MKKKKKIRCILLTRDDITFTYSVGYCVAHIAHDATEKIRIIQTYVRREPIRQGRACVFRLFSFTCIYCMFSRFLLHWKTSERARVRCGCYHHLSIPDYEHTMAHCVALIKSFLFDMAFIRPAPTQTQRHNNEAKQL